MAQKFVEEKAKQFWQSQKTYPKYGTIKQRRLHELNYLVPKLYDKTSLLDIGCGDGALIRALKELTDIEKYYGYDIADNLMQDIPAEIKHYDCTSPEPLPETDVTVCAGVIPFLFHDKQVINLLREIKSPLIYIKAPCSMEEGDIKVDTYSEKLQSDYASIYRTVPHMRYLISRVLKIKEVVRAYPDEIESEFGTKQYIFLCNQ